ncbi:hypothetical protein ASPWEDRAFT_40792 [Aspergillus wentii DTO 134E9]|uniref:Uncharacterized protein n=1 Tax=Aspergillus wentii DTO 134E9 TaxID=1073089 RepID=A0A1L9RL68_ASPWE|nr:uncharacterized protein ASPWEDRAFT_40792 [Aspergillus wentii DTO 134E9]OJJ35587.1 hypothetical protein ASPWEDRAFT_40792 [Aspergillus wentii DTO 134E9]
MLCALGTGVHGALATLGRTETAQPPNRTDRPRMLPSMDLDYLGKRPMIDWVGFIGVSPSAEIDGQTVPDTGWSGQLKLSPLL